MTNKKKKDADSHASAIPNGGKPGWVFKPGVPTIREPSAKQKAKISPPIYLLSEL